MQGALVYTPYFKRGFDVRLLLFRREHCSLCDYAEAALAEAGVRDYRAVEIGWSGELAERYGWRVPVLRDEAGERELDWPFDSVAVRRFVS